MNWYQNKTNLGCNHKRASQGLVNDSGRLLHRDSVAHHNTLTGGYDKGKDFFVRAGQRREGDLTTAGSRCHLEAPAATSTSPLKPDKSIHTRTDLSNTRLL